MSDSEAKQGEATTTTAPTGTAPTGPAPGTPAAAGTSAGRGVLYIAFAKFYFMFAGLVDPVPAAERSCRAPRSAATASSATSRRWSTTCWSPARSRRSREFAAQDPSKARLVQQAGLRMHVRLGLRDRGRVHRRRAAGRVAAPRHEQDRAADARRPDRRRLLVLRGVRRHRERPAPVPQAGRARHHVRHAARWSACSAWRWRGSA